MHRSDILDLHRNSMNSLRIIGNALIENSGIAIQIEILLRRFSHEKVKSVYH